MTSAAELHRFTASDDDDGKRLDQVLAARVPGLSRRKARLLLELGGVFVDRARVKVAGRVVRRGQRIEANLGPALARATPELGRAARERDEAALPQFTVVYKDADVIVVDKPAGLLTAPTPESDRSNLAALLSRRSGGGPIHVVHRLDLPTSGLVVFARSDHANRVLSEKLRLHDVRRNYCAVTRGAFPADATTLSAPVGGRRAITHVRVEERFGERATRIGCSLETGRTHQIRLHCLGVGHPLLGDTRYGDRTDFDPPRLALHAVSLEFEHPRTGAALRFESAWPEDLARWLEALRTAAPSAPA